MNIRRFSGYKNTPLLWKDSVREDIPEMLELEKSDNVPSIDDPRVKLRLGKLVERFFFSELECVNSIDVVALNIQIIKDKITIGELDCIIKNNNYYQHIEVVYKFYLYDEIDSTNELVNWVGPNKKDSLIEKLDKLADKQFPLLYKQEAAYLFKVMVLPSPSRIKQLTFFKAQLFIPFAQEVNFNLLNKECVEGVYVNLDQLFSFSNNQFYIPKKLDWLCKPHEEVNYVDFETFRVELVKWLDKQKSPLCWMKTVQGELTKLFVVWW